MHAVNALKRICILRYAAVLLAAVSAAGCASRNWDQVRQDQADAYRSTLQAATEQALAEGEALVLNDCLRLALENNLAIESAHIAQRIAKLQRDVAFANFLPEVDLSVNYAVWDRQPSTVMFGLLSAPMHDRRMVNTAIDVQMPIFAPATWFLYAMRQRGLDISKLVTAYTREQIALQVTILYFHALALEESERYLESQVAAAEKMRAEAGLYWEEGLLTQWQRDYADARALAQQNSLEKTKRMRIEALSRLSAAMGLSPMADLRLKSDMPLAAPEVSLEDLVLQAMLSHPTLRISDRNVAIQTNRVRIAIAEFLPKLAGLLNYSNTTNSMMKYADATMLGLGGVMTLFDGFANIREYQIARQEKKSAIVQREEACLTVMLAVIRAHLNLENARGDLALAEKALAVASGRLTEIEAQSAEGLVKPSDRLSALADRDAAAANATNARFMEQISIATLLNLVGPAYTGDEDTDHANE